MARPGVLWAGYLTGCAVLGWILPPEIDKAVVGLAGFGLALWCLSCLSLQSGTTSD